MLKAILEIRNRHPRYGVPRLTALLRKRGILVNRKRVYRVTKTMNLLVLQRRKRKKLFIPPTREFPIPQRENQVWAMDFISDRLEGGGKFRCFTVVDIFSRRSPVVHTSISMSEFLPVKVLNELKNSGNLPEAIILDNGPEFANYSLLHWSKVNNVSLHFIDPGKPVQNAYIESFNGRFRDEFLNQNRFKTLSRARIKIEEWRKHYNEERPHSSLDYLTPKEFAQKELDMLITQITNPHLKLVDLKTG